MFPGQGSQVPGMALDLAEQFRDARLVVEEASEALSMNIGKLLGESSVEELRHPAAAQVALVTHALAAAAVLREEGGIDAASAQGTLVNSVLGHSVGEISACAAAGALSLPDAVRLARIRGLAMDWSGSLAGEEPLMLALMGCSADAAAAAVRKHIASAAGTLRPRVAVANINAPGQVVLSGDMTAVRAVEAALREAGSCRRAVPLTVGAAFHSPHMAAGVAALRLLLRPLPPRSCLDPSSKAEPMDRARGRELAEDERTSSRAEAARSRGEEAAAEAARARQAKGKSEAEAEAEAEADAGAESGAAAEAEAEAEAADESAALLHRFFAASPQARALSAGGDRPVAFGPPAVPVVTNIAAEVVWPQTEDAGAALAERLVRQSAGTVQWEACVAAALRLAGEAAPPDPEPAPDAGPEGQWLELGPGSTLAGLVRRCAGRDGPGCAGVGSAQGMADFLRQRR
ncbi:hypothetical protein FNF27_07648 [Cafeteria roenbergensis]|uniref:[acyl-carrier-protein] S-malonyltransferase n=1 Tax=Cafeteria roenbergensis TaxID=33653 RepID=A0A5A8DJ51_CAFRO|nr:hypothetical protein FNF27_07648 [Cafeteria roenbergensis]